MAEKAIDQLNDADMHYKPDSESNSIAIIMKHMSGNMISRWTDFLTTDGEKPTRNRDGEFEEGKETKQQLVQVWEKGYSVFLNTIDSLTENDLEKTVVIRNEKLSVIQAINRQTSHYSYHVGQIVFLAKHIRSSNWKTLSIPKGKSNEHQQGTYLK